MRVGRVGGFADIFQWRRLILAAVEPVDGRMDGHQWSLRADQTKMGGGSLERASVFVCQSSAQSAQGMKMTPRRGWYRMVAAEK